MKFVPKVVLDTNVVLSALLSAQGGVARIRTAWQHELLIPLVSTATAGELIRVLAYPKFKLSIEDQGELLGDYLPFCSSVPMPAKLPATPSCRDAFDVPFLQLAVAGNADFLVTGDKDLLSVVGKLRCPIITATELLAHLDRS